MRVALKVAYDGTRFSGSQVQPPGVRTVHGELASALAALGAPPDARLLWAGRTDAGVSARANVVVFDAPVAPASLLPGLTYRMSDVWAWAWAEVDEGFQPRRARERWYRYHLRTDLDAKLVEDALAPFVGTHDFTSFCKLEPDVDPRRSVFSARAKRHGPHVLVDVVGESFLWNQVRRMVEAARRVAAGELARQEIERALAEPATRDLGTAPPEPLVLMDVAYDGVQFHEEGPRVAERLTRRVEEAEDHLTILRAFRGG